MVAVSDAQQRPTGRGLPPDLSLLRQTPAAQERGTPVQQDDLREVESVPLFYALRPCCEGYLSLALYLRRSTSSLLAMFIY